MKTLRDRAVNVGLEARKVLRAPEPVREEHFPLRLRARQPEGPVRLQLLHVPGIEAELEHHGARGSVNRRVCNAQKIQKTDVNALENVRHAQNTMPKMQLLCVPASFSTNCERERSPSPG